MSDFIEFGGIRVPRAMEPFKTHFVSQKPEHYTDEQLELGGSYLVPMLGPGIHVHLDPLIIQEVIGEKVKSQDSVSRVEAIEKYKELNQDYKKEKQ